MESGDTTLAECRICQEEDTKGNLEIPCACSGTLKYVHRKCLEHWSHKKGDSICELCYQQYKPKAVDQMPEKRSAHQPKVVDQMHEKRSAHPDGADASAQQGSSLRRRHSSSGSAANPRSGSRQRIHEQRRPATPHAPAGESSGSHSGSLSLDDIDDEATVGVGGEAPHKEGARMDIKWREREHEEFDNHVLENQDALTALRNCGLLKFFKCPSIRSQKELLQLLISYWDVEHGYFKIDDEIIHLDVEDIYFITGLSRRGIPVNMRYDRGLNMLSVDEYILAHCPPETKKMSSQVPINKIIGLPLRAILFGINRVTGDAGSHQASRIQMYYAIECLTGVIFDWCTIMLAGIKSQLKDCRTGKLKEFRYGSVLVAFFLERVPGMRPRVDRMPDGRIEPRLVRWSQLLYRLGGGTAPSAFDDAFFYWWKEQKITVEDFPYAGMDFRHDPDLVLPPNARWGTVDVGPVRPVGYTFRQRRPREEKAPREAAETTLRNLIQSFQNLTKDVPESEIYDLPMRVQREVVGVPVEWSHILRRVATILVSYARSHTGTGPSS